MKANHTRYRQWLALLGATAGLSLHAGEVLFDFNEPPEIDTFTTFGVAPYPEWRQFGGKDDTGYFAITDSFNDLNGTLIIPDIDDGKVIKAFEFSVDVRIGDGTGNPADGFSINYARAGDPVLTTGNGYVSGAMEEGTTTGLAVSFDTYDNGNGDVVGISVRVDGNIVFSRAYTTRNGQIGDLTSLQTGPQGDMTGSSLAWEPFTVKLSEAGLLTITYKNDPVVTDLEVPFFPSPGRMVFAARTGGENEMHHIDNLFLKTTPATSPTVGVAVAQGSGFILPIDDAGTIQPNVGTIVAKLNNEQVTPVVSRSGSQTLVSFIVPGEFFPAGSTQEVNVTFTDSGGATVNETRSFVVPNYTLFGSAWKSTSFDANSSGFNVLMTQIIGGRYPGDANSIANGETQIAGGIIDPGTGLPYDNIADLSAATDGIFVEPVINWDQEGFDIDANNPDNFNSVEPADNPVPNTTIPGILTGDPNNIAAAITTCLELKRGSYILGVNSDDGFLLTLGHSPLGPVIGSFNGGRGASDTLMNISVAEDGVYPVRLSWWEGGGGANVEFFSVDPVTGEKTLVNDRTQPDAIKAYNVCTGPAFVQSILPAEGAVDVSVTPTIKVVLKDDATSVDDGSIKIVLNGQELSTTVANDGDLTTVTATVPQLEYRSTATGQVIFTAGGVTYTNEFSFQVEARGFAIEAEDFDFDGGQFVESVNTMPYTGVAYDDLFGLPPALNNIDYFQTYDEVNGQAYRFAEVPNVPMGLNDDVADRERPGFVLDAGMNYSIGWAGAGEWYNYTRVFTNGNYKIIAGQSHGDAAGTPDRLVASFGVVLSGHGTDQQVVARVGSYSAPSAGGWGVNAVNTAQSGGEDTVIHLDGQTTMRVFIDSGDFDWFALIPTTARTAKPSVMSVSPSRPVRTVDQVTFELLDKLSDTSVDTSSVQLSINGTAVTGLQVTDNDNGATVSYTVTTPLPVGENSYTLTYKDSEGTTLTSSGSLLVVGMENFVIEAEDFNFGGGQTVAEASTMPLQSGLYAEVDPPVHDVDYHVNQDQPDGNEYRLNETPNVPTPTTGGLNRGSFDLQANYRIGWDDTGEWWNYTRTFPAGTYNVYAGISRDVGTMGGRLDLVADATVQNQTLTPLGTFQAPASGAWGQSALVVLRDNSGAVAKVELSGTKTVRFSSDFGNGDIDYLLFVETEGNVGGDEPVITITRGANNQITITWTNGGTLQSTPALGPNAQWTDVGSTGTATITADQAAQFFRVVK